jgi:hypothetical protein
MATRGGRNRKGGAFTIAGRVGHWDPLTRELTNGGRVLWVASSVFFIGHVGAGVLITASGYHPPDLDDQWIVTELRVG